MIIQKVLLPESYRIQNVNVFRNLSREYLIGFFFYVFSEINITYKYKSLENILPFNDLFLLLCVLVTRSTICISDFAFWHKTSLPHVDTIISGVSLTGSSPGVRFILKSSLKVISFFSSDSWAPRLNHEN